MGSEQNRRRKGRVVFGANERPLYWDIVVRGLADAGLLGPKRERLAHMVHILRVRPQPKKMVLGVASGG